MLKPMTTTFLRFPLALRARLASAALLGLAFTFAVTAQQPEAPATAPAAAAQVPAATPDAAKSATPAAQDSAAPVTPATAAPAAAATPQTPAATPAVPAAQQPAAAQTAPQPETPSTETATAKAAAAPPAVDTQSGGITEEQLKQMLLGKPLYLRGGYLDSTLGFNEHGGITGHPAQGSYTLCGIEIEKIHLTKHKVELYGARYGLHFLGALPYEDPTTAADRVRITPKKKALKITIDREMVVKPKKAKDKGKQSKGPAAKPAAAAAGDAAKPPAAEAAASTEAKPAEASAPNAPDADKGDSSEMSEADQLKASIAAAPEAEKPADPGSVTTTISPAHATQVLKDALDKIFAPGLDERMMAAMPDFWKLYYQAVAAKSDYRPKDPAVLRQSTVDKKAHLLSNFEPASNEFAQANGVAGMALYHTVIGADGKPGEIAVARPIGFGLDENAVAAIRNAKFEPAIKDGKPVPVLLDLVVQFRIFSKRTAVSDAPTAADKAASPQPEKKAEPILPGPYSRQQQQQQPQAQPQQ
jgi:TonB family protein